ncbi:hypothetical protein A2Z00_01755 [Candidatus Gottesmanbacteria bacterium RBG_13_45_10]|uniref:Ribosomal RNA large subunit methyltransferase K/L-like methyltransferase domain-containing protein n=1 Tax=Candidatus Gottesmanbacteria bacterium RBG_13_45_10 TaxID=1798370 RepID=A0A1F5ZFI2_9BACT|nr:MAG: hypothetical protein A2Z00_01755 [Candidatus Gottesmanbacteria bacterium RBG_13_45_10]
MTGYLFVFGRTPALAFLELKSFFPNASLISPDVAYVPAVPSLDGPAIISALGGTVKIAKVVGRLSELAPQTIVPYLPGGQDITFGLSAYGNVSLPRSTLHDMKKALEVGGRKARFVEARHGNALSSVVIEKNQVHELVIVPDASSYIVAHTLAVQPFEAWGERDFGRPYADAKAGMLPPKVARMIVNIAKPTVQKEHKTLLDPFCGMGTVLGEGLLAGWDVIGSDISKQVIQKAHENLIWLLGKHPGATGKIVKMLVSEAVHIADILPPNSVDAIVTEPYMGSTDIASRQPTDPEELRNTIKGLEKLYIGCLRNWHTILSSRGKVIIALPAYAIQGHTYFVKKVVDMCENLGYTIVEGPIDYSRPQAVVKRNFFVLQKSNPTNTTNKQIYK